MIAADRAGITIPRLCAYKGLTSVGACRLCVVEIAGIPRLLPACATRVAEGMDVSTKPARLVRYRRMTLELLLAERNHICAGCVSNGHCELQNLMVDHGLTHTCTSCGKCVQVCPVGALFEKGRAVGEMEKKQDIISCLVAGRAST